MKKQILLIIVLFCMCSLSFSQTAPGILWTKTYGGTGTEVGYSVQQTSDGGYIIGGYTNSYGAGGNDVYLIKTDANGDTTWTMTYGGSQSDKGYSVKQTADEGYIIAGETSSFGAGYEDVYLIKTDANGDTVWTKTIGGTGTEIGYSVDELTEGGYIIAGTTAPSFFPKDYLIKTDTNGEVIWTKTYGEGMMSWWKEVQETDDGAYITAGWMMSPNDVYLAKTDSDGSTIWTQTINLGDDQYGNAVQQTSDGGYIIAGETWSNDTQKWDYCLIKRDANGDAEWATTYGGTEWDKAYSVKQVLWDEGYIITGETESFGAGNYDIYIVRVDSLGNTLWTQTYGGTSADAAYSVQQTEDSGYIICGKSSGDVYLIKIGPEFEPIPPVVTIKITGNDAVLTWDPVETTTTGNPITVDRYNIYYGDTPDSPFSFLGETADTTYTHSGVGAVNNKKFYQVTAVVE
jgi:hypothetical protein